MRPTQPSKGPSQRQLRVGEHALVALLILLFLINSMPTAIAEVCDKAVGEHWTRADGPVSTVPFGGFHVLKAPVVALLLMSSIAAAVVVRFRRARRSMALFFAILCAFLAGLLVALGIYELHLINSGEPVTLAAIREGCVTTSPTGGIEGPAVIFVVSALCFWVWYNHQEKGVAS